LSEVYGIPPWRMADLSSLEYAAIAADIAAKNRAAKDASR